MTLLLNVINTAGCAALAALIHPRLRSRRYQGRLITLPLAHRLKQPPTLTGTLLLLATVLTLAVALPIALNLNHPEVARIINLGITLPALDDLLTGGTPRWRKRLQTLRNRIRWATYRPAPNPA